MDTRTGSESAMQDALHSDVLDRRVKQWSHTNNMPPSATFVQWFAIAGTAETNVVAQPRHCLACSEIRQITGPSLCSSKQIETCDQKNRSMVAQPGKVLRSSHDLKGVVPALPITCRRGSRGG